MDNIIGIINQMKDSFENYENHVDREHMTAHERVLDTLEHDYMRFCNHDEWLAALKGFLTEDEAEIWNLYPEYTRIEKGITIAEAQARAAESAKPQLQALLPQLTRSLVDKAFIFEYKQPDGSAPRYVGTYLLDVLVGGINYYDGSPLHKACLNWWNIMSEEAAESEQLRSTMSQHRVIAHEATLTGDAKYGKIPMNMEIPDKRQVLDIDQMSEMLKRCHTYAVFPCVCRNAKEKAGIRECDYPLDVCLLFDESAELALEMGTAKPLTYEGTMDIIRQCRDKGMVQVISNAEHPLSVCNCCECCCVCLMTLNRGETSIAEISNFVVDVIHHEECIKCGQCMNVCPANAMEVHDNYIQTGLHECLGCGLCVSKCPKGVLRMVRRPGASDTLKSEYTRRLYL